MLSQYGPDLLVQCESALDMSKDLVRTWLKTYMFQGMGDCSERAEEVSAWLAGRDNFKSDSRHIPRREIEERQLRVFRLEDDQALQDKMLSIFHATTHTFSGTSSVKIVENHMGRAFIKQHAVQPVPAVQLDIAQAGPSGPAPA